MEMRNEKEVITRMMNLWGEVRRLTQDNRLDNGNDAETQTQFKEVKNDVVHYGRCSHLGSDSKRTDQNSQQRLEGRSNRNGGGITWAGSLPD